MASIAQVQSGRSFDPVTGINNRWISTEYDSLGQKTREFWKNPDGNNRKITYSNQTGSVLRVEFLNPEIAPSKILGPIYAVSRLR